MLLFFTVWINFCSTFFAHPMYFSYTNMDIDAQGGCVLLSVRLFADDMETVLHNKYNIEGWIGTKAEHRDGRRLLREYLNERFSITVNNSEKIELVADSMTIVKDDETVFCFYMKGVARQSISRMEIDNRLLTDFFEKQSNLMIISTGRNEKAYKLNRKNHIIELSLE